MPFVVSTAFALGAIIGFKSDRFLLATTIGSGTAAGIFAMALSGTSAISAADGLMTFAASIGAGFATGLVTRAAIHHQLVRRVALQRSKPQRQA